MLRFLNKYDTILSESEVTAMATISERLKQALKIRNMKQADLVRLTGICKSSISTYISGAYLPKQKNISKIASALRVSEAWLIGENVPMEKEKLPKNIIPINPNTKYIKIPVVGRIAAGINCITDMEIIGYESVPISEISCNENYVYLTVVGDSMYPKIEEGDLALVRCQKSVDNGSIAVVIIDNEDGVIKRIKYGNDWVELHPVNPMYPVRRFENEDVSRIHVYGLVKEIIRRL